MSKGRRQISVIPGISGDALAGLVLSVFQRWRTCLDSDVAEDWMQEARLELNRISPYLAALPEEQRQFYAATCIRRYLHRLLQRELRRTSVCLRSSEPEIWLLSETRSETLKTVGWFPQPDDWLGRDDLIVLFYALEDQDRELLTLFFRDELSDAQIALALNSTPGAIRVRRHRIVARLRDYLASTRKPRP